VTALEPEQAGVSEHGRALGKEESEDQRRKGLQSYWGALPWVWKVLTVALPTVAAIFGILAPLGLIGPRSSPAPPPGEFQGFILGQTGLEVRKTAMLSGSVVASLPPGTTVYIVCTATGDAVSGPRHGGGTLTTRIWDYIRTASSTGPLGFVPDAWVDTGTTKPVTRAC
jgi:hypothetical protein